MTTEITKKNKTRKKREEKKYEVEFKVKTLIGNVEYFGIYFVKKEELDIIKGLSYFIKKGDIVLK